jgi:DNA invertase Pin-like site-specific DNA recombinase
MLTVLGGLAEFERSLIVARTARAGHEHRRKALGSAGRGRSMRINGGKLLHAWDAGDAAADVARTFGCNRATIYRLRSTAV